MSPDSMASVGGGAASGAMAGSALGPYGAIAGMVIGAVGSGVSAYGQASAGEASASMYAYKAGIAKINAQIARQNADYARATGEVEAQQSGMQTRYQIGQTEATQAKSGLDVNRGSAELVRESEAEVGQENEAIIRSNAARRAYGYEVEAVKDTAEGTLDQMASSQSRQAGYIAAAGSIISGASSVASKWTQYGTAFGSGNPTSPGPYQAPVGPT